MPNEQVKSTSLNCSTHTTQDATYSEFDDRNLRWTEKMLTMVGTDLLPIVKEDSSQYKCICPVCGEDNLKISKSGSGYNCFRNHCEHADIREALIPARSEFRHEGNRIRISQQAKEDIIPAKLPSKPLEFAIADSKNKPEPRKNKYGFKKKRNDGDGEFECDTVIYTEYKYESVTIDGTCRSREVQRTEYLLEGKRVGSKSLIPRHQTYLTEGWVKGKDRVKVGEAKPGEKQKDKPTTWTPYRIEEVRANAKGKILFGVEGEKAVESVRSLGLAATTQQGSDWGVEGLKQGVSELKRAEVSLLFYVADNDKAGEKKRQDIAIAAAKEGLPCIGISITALYPEAPEKYDIADYIEDQQNLGRTIMEIKTEIEEKVQTIAAEEVQKQAEANKSFEDKLFDEMVQVSLNGFSTNTRLTKKLELKRLAKDAVFGKDFDELWDEAERKAAFIEAVELTEEKLRRDIALELKELDLEEILPLSLANPIKNVAKSLGQRSECYLTALLAGISGQHKVGSTISIRHDAGKLWKEPLSLQAMIPGQPGAMKTDIVKTAVTKPLNAIKTELVNEVERRRTQNKKQIKDWENGGEKGDKPEALGVPYVIISTYSKESLEEVLHESKEFGLTIVRDELAGLFGDLNSRTGGKGSDRQFLLQVMDGEGVNTKFRNRTSYTPVTQVAMVGTIQPEVLAKLMGNGEDDDGLWSRWLFCEQPLNRKKIDLSEEWGGGVSINIDELIQYLYAKINKLPKGEYDLTDRRSFRIFASFYNECIEKIETEQNPLLVHIYAKMQKIAAKLIANLHVLHYVAAGKQPPRQIQPEIVYAGIKCAKFFLSEARKIANATEDDFAGLSEILIKSIKAAQKREWITATNIKKEYPSHKREKIPVEECHRAMRDLEEMGLGECKKDGKLKFRLKVQGQAIAASQESSKLDKYYDIRRMVIAGEDISGMDSLGFQPYVPPQAPSFKFTAQQIADAKENEPFDFESSPYNPDNGFNPADLQPATPKGSDSEALLQADRTQEQGFSEAVAGVSEAIEVEAVEIEEAATGSSFKAISRRCLKELKSALYSVDQDTACDREPEVITVDGKTFSIGEVVKLTKHDTSVEVKVLAKGLIEDSETEGFVVEYLQAKIPPEAKADEYSNVQSGDWIVGAGETRTTSAEFLSKLTDEDLATPDNTKQEKLINIQGINHMPGATVWYKPGTDEVARVELLGESGTGEVIVFCIVTLPNSKCSFGIGAMAWVDRSDLRIHHF